MIKLRIIIILVELTNLNWSMKFELLYYSHIEFYTKFITIFIFLRISTKSIGKFPISLSTFPGSIRSAQLYSFAYVQTSKIANILLFKTHINPDAFIECRDISSIQKLCWVVRGEFLSPKIPFSSLALHRSRRASITFLEGFHKKETSPQHHSGSSLARVVWRCS